MLVPCCPCLVVKALAQLGSPGEALKHWEDCLNYNVKYCPPHDEATVCYAFQAALCSLAADKVDSAVVHVLTAVKAHAVAFGPGLPLFHARYATELATAAPSLKRAAAKLKAMLSADDTGDRYVVEHMRADGFTYDLATTFKMIIANS